MAYPTAKCVHQLGNKGPEIPAHINPAAHACSICTPDEGNGFCPRFHPVTVFVFQVEEALTQEEAPQPVGV